MLNSHTINHWITRYHEGTLDGTELDQFLELLEKDVSLRAETELDKELSDFLQDRDLLEFRKFLDKSGNKKNPDLGIRFLLIAASLLFLLAMAGGWIYLYASGYKRFFHDVDLEKAVTNVPSRKNLHMPLVLRKSPGYNGNNLWEHPRKQILLSSAYKPLPYLEGLVGMVTRAEKFSSLAPGFLIRVHPGEPVQLTWEPPTVRSVSLELFDNKGKKVAEYRNITGGEVILETTRLTKGLYYWKFLQDDTLLFVGKILIGK